jgi:hypothetical protein
MTRSSSTARRCSDNRKRPEQPSRTRLRERKVIKTGPRRARSAAPALNAWTPPTFGRVRERELHPTRPPQPRRPLPPSLPIEARGRLRLCAASGQASAATWQVTHAASTCSRPPWASARLKRNPTAHPTSVELGEGRATSTVARPARDGGGVPALGRGRLVEGSRRSVTQEVAARAPLQSALARNRWSGSNRRPDSPGAERKSGYGRWPRPSSFHLDSWRIGGECARRCVRLRQWPCTFPPSSRPLDEGALSL